MADTQGAPRRPVASPELYTAVHQALGTTSASGVPTSAAAAFGSAVECLGTAFAFTPTSAREIYDQSMESRYMNIGFMPVYNRWSAEELRLADYDRGRRFRPELTTCPACSGTRVHVPGSRSRSRSRSGSVSQSYPFNTITPVSINGKPRLDGKEKPKADDLEWLRNRYSGITPISITCGSDETTYLFPREVLMPSFKYFQDYTGQQDAAEEKVHHFKDITALAFARLVRWRQTEPDNREDPANPDGDYSVQDLLDQLIAAEHLQLVEPKPFMIHISALLATVLLHDRRKLTSEHINLVKTHPAFQEPDYHGFVMRVLVKAGLRPCLQSTMLSPASVWNAQRAKPGHADKQEWLAVLEHCRKLRADNKDYALSVAEHVAEVLENVKRNVDGHAVFYDSLDEDDMKGQRRLGFNAGFSI